MSSQNLKVHVFVVLVFCVAVNCVEPPTWFQRSLKSSKVRHHSGSYQIVGNNGHNTNNHNGNSLANTGLDSSKDHDRSQDRKPETANNETVCENGGKLLLRSFCQCSKEFYGKFCQHHSKNKSCGGIIHGAWVETDCNLCRCYDGLFHCIPTPAKDCYQPRPAYQQYFVYPSSYNGHNDVDVLSSASYKHPFSVFPVLVLFATLLL